MEFYRKLVSYENTTGNYIQYVALVTLHLIFKLFKIPQPEKIYQALNDFQTNTHPKNETLNSQVIYIYIYIYIALGK